MSLITPPSNITYIINKLTMNEYEAFIVGGAVRDALLGIEPHDYDLVTNAYPEQIAGIFPEAITTGNSFLVSRIGDIELATYRKDRADSAVVAHTLEEDVIRRDFTWNALAYDLKNDKIIDYVGGVQDIEQGLIRFVGNPYRRIEEDPVRMLRGLRLLCTQPGLTVESMYSDTYGAILTSHQKIEKVPMERIYAEVIKAFSTKYPASFVAGLGFTCLLDHVFPAFAALRGLPGGPHHAETLDVHCLYALKAVQRFQKPWLSLSALYHDVGKVKAEYVDQKPTFPNHHMLSMDLAEQDFRRLKAPNDAVHYISQMCRLHMSSLDSPRAIKRLNHRLLELNIPLKDFMLLRYADKRGNLKTRTETEFADIRKKYKECLKIIKATPAFSVKSLDINGNILMKECNLVPGPELGRILKNLLEDVLDEKVNNEQFALLERARELINV